MDLFIPFRNSRHHASIPGPSPTRDLSGINKLYLRRPCALWSIGGGISISVRGGSSGFGECRKRKEKTLSSQMRLLLSARDEAFWHSLAFFFFFTHIYLCLLGLTRDDICCLLPVAQCSGRSHAYGDLLDMALALLPVPAYVSIESNTLCDWNPARHNRILLFVYD